MNELLMQFILEVIKYYIEQNYGRENVTKRFGVNYELLIEQIKKV